MASLVLCSVCATPLGPRFIRHPGVSGHVKAATACRSAINAVLSNGNRGSAPGKAGMASRPDFRRLQNRFPGSPDCYPPVSAFLGREAIKHWMPADALDCRQSAPPRAAAGGSGSRIDRSHNQASWIMVVRSLSRGSRPGCSCCVDKHRERRCATDRAAGQQARRGDDEDCRVPIRRRRNVRPPNTVHHCL
jgi:hypothetical protein